ncbi:MAG: D-hexose-6-phosphate mutarotase [Xylophilus ampelinus]
MPQTPTAIPTVTPTTFHDLPALRLALPGGDAAIVALQGAQVLSWTTADGSERLYLSPKAVFDGRHAIRGGVPVCFPQFNQRGPASGLPKHGFARGMAWTPLDGAAAGPAADAGAARAVLRLGDDAATRALWPHGFEARLAVTLLPGALRLALAVENTGGDEFAFTAALHGYLRVPGIAATRLHGLGGLPWHDTVRDVRHAAGSTAADAALDFAGETDSIYRAPSGPLRIDGPRGPVLRLEQSAEFTDTVVWNPGAALVATLSDMPSDGHADMLCVEAARIAAPARLAPGARWEGWQRFTAP